MAKDSKSAPPRGGNGGRAGMHPMLMGILIGLLLGVALALGVAIWLNRASSPFVEKAKPVEALPTLPAKPPGKAEGTAAPDAGGEKPRFDFYKILPGEKEGGPAKKPAETKSEPAKPAADGKPAPDAKHETAKPAPDTKPAEEAKAARDAIYLQAGAFQNSTDAENLKAKIAFTGLEAMVKPVNLGDKGTLYRVRLGPYSNIEEANRIKATLSQSGVSTAVVKGD